MRLRAMLFAAIVFAGAGASAFWLAGRAADWVEASTRDELASGLQSAGQPWASASVDGLEVTLTGAAPDETARFRALEAARQVVDEGRITDATTLSAAALAPPAFALELLRNDADISLIGLVPDAGGRDVIEAALRAAGLADQVADMLESAADPVPEGWRDALGYGLAVLAELPRAKISVTPGAVGVISVADSAEDRTRLEARLRSAAPDDITLALDISAPRPVIAPFAFDLRVAGGTATLAACSADSDEAAAAILAAARAAGLTAAAACPVGLGSPSPDWATAVGAGIAALGQLGGGRFVLRDLDAQLSGPDGTDPARLAKAAADLDAALPEAFRLATVAPPPPDDGTTPAEAPWFDATLLLDGTVRLAGHVRDETARAATESFAAALFGHDRVVDNTMLDDRLPDGWPTAVLAGIEALSGLQEGRLEVTGDRVRLEGWTLDASAPARVEAQLDAKVGARADVDVTFNAEAAAAAAQAARPRPEICADEINAILDAGSIRFAAGSAEIVPESAGIIAAIADVLRGCPGAEFEIAGHTDAQGPEDANRALSEERAAAVVDALEAEDLPLVTLSARGYGASQPVADNATPAGRARNRRIEFTLGPVPHDEPPGEGEEATVAATGDATGDDTGDADDCAARVALALAQGSVTFEPGSADIAPASAPVLDAMRAALATCPDAALEVGGYTDSEGSDDGNLRLSQRRAEAVLTALRSDALPLAAMTARGYGEADPVADNATAEGRAKNRRIAVVPAAANEDGTDDGSE